MAGAIIFLIIAVVCSVLVIYDVFTNQKKMKSSQKITWTIFAILFSVITAIVYYFTVKSKKTDKVNNKHSK